MAIIRKCSEIRTSMRDKKIKPDSLGKLQEQYFTLVAAKEA